MASLVFRFTLVRHLGISTVIYSISSRWNTEQATRTIRTGRLMTHGDQPWWSEKRIHCNYDHFPSGFIQETDGLQTALRRLCFRWKFLQAFLFVNIVQETVIVRSNGCRIFDYVNRSSWKHVHFEVRCLIPFIVCKASVSISTALTSHPDLNTHLSLQKNTYLITIQDYTNTIHSSTCRSILVNQLYDLYIINWKLSLSVDAPRPNTPSLVYI